MWERFAEHAPTVGISAVAAGVVSMAIEARAAIKRRDSSGCGRLVLLSTCSGVLGLSGAAIFAASVVELLPSMPWVVVGLSVLAGLTGDVATRAGVRRWFRLMLKLHLQIARTLADEELKS